MSQKFVKVLTSNSRWRKRVLHRANKRGNQHFLSHCRMQMVGDFPQADRGVGADSSLIVAGLQSGKMAHHLQVQVVVI